MVERNMSNAVMRGIVSSRRGRGPHHVHKIASEPGISRVWPSLPSVCAEFGGPHREGEEPEPMMHGHEKSDFAIVAVKPANNAGQSAAEPVERRAETKGNAGQQSTHRTQSRASVSQALERIRQVVAVWTRGRSRMRESCTYGSVRGALSNERPYRDPKHPTGSRMTLGNMRELGMRGLRKPARGAHPRSARFATEGV